MEVYKLTTLAGNWKDEQDQGVVASCVYISRAAERAEEDVGGQKATTALRKNLKIAGSMNRCITRSKWR
jgi:hypothetical protein